MHVSLWSVCWWSFGRWSPNLVLFLVGEMFVLVFLRGGKSRDLIFFCLLCWDMFITKTNKKLFLLKLEVLADVHFWERWGSLIYGTAAPAGLNNHRCVTATQTGWCSKKFFNKTLRHVGYCC